MGYNLLVNGIYWDHNPLTNPFTNFLGHPSGSTLTFSLRGLVGSPNIPITYCSQYSIVCGLGFLDRICKIYIYTLIDDPSSGKSGTLLRKIWKHHIHVLQPKHILGGFCFGNSLEKNNKKLCKVPFQGYPS